MRKYIAFEGLDLSGKTTIINNIKLKRSEYIYTKEPGGFNNDLSLKIRDLILNYKDEIDPIVETYLFAASRAIDMKETNDFEKKIKIRRQKEENKDYRYVEDLLRDKLDTKVKIKDKKIEISFNNVADLNRILEIIDVKEWFHG